jgi:single-stranded-DNA-specific exonuclease
MPMRNSTKKWFFPELIDVPGDFRSQIGGFSIISQTLFRRGITTLEAAKGFLDPDFYTPAPPAQLPDLSIAASRLISAISNQEPILVWGDFDVDGQTSTSLLFSALDQVGANVSFYIPNRASESHGIPLSSLKSQVDIIHPSVLLTCDTGVDALEAITYAQNQGIDVIITDHHQLPDTIPPAYAVVNPNLLPPEHSLFSLPGVGVAYKLVEEIYHSFSLSTEQFLDLVALGIVSDVAQLTGDTRYLLQRGLVVLSDTPRLGLQQLFINSSLSNESISEDQISYVIAPRLNALGRLDDANSCVDFFTTSDLQLASGLAKQLEDLNNQRQLLTETIFHDSIEKIESHPDLLSDYPVLVLDGPPSWNPGVIGIVASRLVERFDKPVLMLTKEGDQARGSARSIPGVPISDLIKISSKLLNRHGGHPMAAGVSLPHENISQFRRELAENFSLVVGAHPPVPEIYIDEILPFQSVSIDYIKDFYRLAPFGAGNPHLLFASRGVFLVQDKIIGKNKNHRKLTLKDSSGTVQDVLWWNSAGIELPRDPFDLAFSLSISTYQNKPQIQATLQHFKESTPVPVQIKLKAPLEILDYRNSSQPKKILSEIIHSHPDSIIWAEYKKPPDFPSYSRGDLPRTSTLIIWTAPPSVKVLKNVIDEVSPDTLILFGLNPFPHKNRKVLEILLGLLQHLDITGKDFDPDLFAQSAAVTSSLVLTGIDWIHHHGDYDLSKLMTDNIISSGSGAILPGFDLIDKKFNLLLQEISSYRLFFLKSDKEYIL